MTKFHRRVGGFCVVLILLCLVPGPVAGLAAGKTKAQKGAPASKAEPSMAPSDALPVPELTLGARAGDSIVEGYGDILAPIYATKSGIFFVNPRMSATDHDAEEYNLGVGYRHLLREKGMIVGANIYYDHRETEAGNQFDQIGLGVEYLSDWVDARANYYLPDDDQEKMETEVVTETQSSSSWTSWEDPYAVGNAIYQDGTWKKAVTTTTTKQRFVQYEEAMEGWDAEMGVRLPIPVVMDYADVKLFGGFYHYNGNFGSDDLDGFKGRVEIKTMPSLYLDVEVFEDKELTGHDYYLGARMSVPFDIANISKGRNPFAGALDGMRIQKQKTTIASRLTEMVMRDLHVQTDFSQVEEDVEKRQQTSSTQIVDQHGVSDTLGTGVIFVNQDTGNDSNPGTYEAPVQQIPTGIGLGDNVFVMATVGPYLLSLEIGKNVNLMGQGFPIGHDGRYLNGDSRYAVIKGAPGAPTVFVNGPAGANNVQIRGFEIQNEFIVPADLAELLAANPLDSIDVAVDSVQSFELAHSKLDNAMIGFGAMCEDMPGFTANIHDNLFDSLGLGAAVVAFNSTGELKFNNNFIQNTLIGMVGVALADDALSPAVLNAEITGNHVLGGGLNMLGMASPSPDDIELLEALPQGMFPEALESVDPDNLGPVGDLPSLSALNVAAIQIADGAFATVNATISGNTIENNLLGIGAIGVGSNANMNVNISNNQLLGGGLDLLGTDQSLVGIWVAGVDEATVNHAVVANNAISDHLLGIAMVGYDEATLNHALIENNTIADSLLGIGVVGINGSSLNNATIANNALANDLLGIGVVGINGSSLDNARIANNVISDGILGIGVAGINGSSLSNTVIANNSMPNTLLGVLALGYGGAAMDKGMITDNRLPGGLAGVVVAGLDGSTMDGWTISGNQITGSGIPAILSSVLSSIPTDVIPAEVSTALVSLPDAGLGGVVVVGAGSATSMDEFKINSNVINNELLGVGVLGLSGASMTNYDITHNTINRTLVGVAAGGVGGALMQDYDVSRNVIRESLVGVLAGVADGANMDGLTISHNTIVGGGVDDLFAALQPLANTNIIDDARIVAFLDTPMPDTGVIGVAALNSSGEMNGLSIENNAISKNLVGVLGAATADAHMNDMVIGNNTINNSTLGVGLFIQENAYANNATIRNNVINDPAIGILTLADDTTQMNNLLIGGNQVNRSLLGILVASEHDAQMTNIVISANTVSGANNPTQLGLLSAFLVLTDFDDNMGWLIHREWNPLAFPNSGLVGVDVRVNQANQTDVRIDGNQFSNFDQAGLVTIEDVANLPITYINNTSSDGQFYVAATNATFILTESGNIPGPVVIVP